LGGARARLLQPISAFLAYARFDDEYHGGFVGPFAHRLSRAVRLLTGADFQVFYDRHISWGEVWSNRIEREIANSSALIAVLTPSFFASANCRREVKLFLDRERALGREDLIFPVHYVECEQLRDCSSDSLASLFQRRQWVDWRNLRGKPMDDPDVVREVEILAAQIKRVLTTQVAEPNAETAVAAASEGSLAHKGSFRLAPGAFRARVEAAYFVLRSIINEADPVGLLNSGAPEDEYDPEVRDILLGLPGYFINAQKVGHLVVRVFDSWFSPGTVSEDEGQRIGDAIYTKLRELLRPEDLQALAFLSLMPEILRD